VANAPATELITRYRDAAERTGDPDPAAASEAAHEAHELYKQLRDTAEGRAGLTALMLHPHPQVRRWAATHSLSWKRETARAVLAELNRGSPS
jgi:hypothetical protein